MPRPAATATLLKRIAADHAVIVVEHDMAFVRDLDCRVTVLHEGSVLAEGSLDHVSADPRRGGLSWKVVIKSSPPRSGEKKGTQCVSIGGDEGHPCYLKQHPLAPHLSHREAMGPCPLPADAGRGREVEPCP